MQARPVEGARPRGAPAPGGAGVPDAEPTHLLETLRGSLSRGRDRPEPVASAGELELLARLHADGSLDDKEFPAAKARVLDQV